MLYTRQYSLLVVGTIAIAVLAGFQLPQSKAQIRDCSRALHVPGIADPREILILKEADYSPGLGNPPFVVPPGKLLVITALGTEVNGGAAGRIYLDGMELLHAGGPASMASIPPHLVLHAGSELTLGDGSSATHTARAWGYLLDE